MQTNIFGKHCLLLILLIYIYDLTFCFGDDSFKLKQVITIIRHGDRSPIEEIHEIHPKVNWKKCFLPSKQKGIFNEDINFQQIHHIDYNSYNNWKKLKKTFKLEDFSIICTPGQLTIKGFNQLYSLGKEIRMKYENTLTFNKEDIFVESSPIDRTIQSAQAFIQGLFNSNNEILIPIHTFDIKTSSLFPNYQKYSELNTHLHEYYTTNIYYKKFITETLDFKLQLTNLLNISDIPSWLHLYDNTMCRIHNDYELNVHFNESLINRIVETFELSFLYQLQCRKFIVLGMKDFFKRIIDNILTCQANNCEFKFLLFSGHDTTIAPFLAFLGLYNGILPKYASSIVLEIYEDLNNELYLSMEYNGKELNWKNSFLGDYDIISFSVNKHLISFKDFINFYAKTINILR